MKLTLKPAVVLLIAIAAGAFLFLTSCSPKEPGSPVYTKTLITRTEMAAKLSYGFFSDKYSSDVYEVVDYDYLMKAYHDAFWERLFRDKITKWNPRANCTIFTEKYVDGLQTDYYNDHFVFGSKAMKLAVGEFWYIPNSLDYSIAHSVVIVFTNKGLIYLEPQSKNAPKILNLTEAQIASRILLKI